MCEYFLHLMISALVHLKIRKIILSFLTVFLLCYFLISFISSFFFFGWDFSFLFLYTCEEKQSMLSLNRASLSFLILLTQSIDVLHHINILQKHRVSFNSVKLLDLSCNCFLFISLCWTVLALLLTKISYISVSQDIAACNNHCAGYCLCLSSLAAHVK